MRVAIAVLVGFRMITKEEKLVTKTVQLYTPALETDVEDIVWLLELDTISFIELVH